MKYLYCYILLFAFHFSVKAQIINRVTDTQEAPKVQLKRSTSKITLDGILDEDAWVQAQSNSNFSQYFPTDSLVACGETEMYFTYDDEYFYIAAKCYTPSDRYTVESLKRDYGFGSNDNISFLIDTYNDKTNCYLFGMNPYGVRREALIWNGGRTGDAFDSSWDNKWDGDSKRFDNYWTCELAIPFKTIRYKEGADHWRFNSYRNDAQCNEITTWINIPRQNSITDLIYMGELNFEEPLGKPGTNVSIIPYASAGITRDFENIDQTKAQSAYNIGGDAKIGLTSSLNLDLTVNPDFSQVEVDRQVTNLDRFEIFFPERRQFFLENADLFSSFGTGRMNPFFSRRIGVSIDTTTGNNVENTIYGGARISGKLSNKLRVGLINMVTAPQKENDLPTFNYNIAAAEYQVGDRNSIGLIFVNKDAINRDEFSGTVQEYDRVAGLEYRLGSKNNYWRGKTSFMAAITPNEEDGKYAHYTQITYLRRQLTLQWTHQIIGAGFDAEVGFVPRRDILSFTPFASYSIYPKSGKVSEYNASLSWNSIYKLGQDDNEIIEDFQREETELSNTWSVSYNNNHRLDGSFSYNNFTLLNSFDPTRIQDDDVFLSAGQKFNNYLATISYRTDSRKTFFIDIDQRIGRFFDGTRYSAEATVTYRYVPYGSISINAEYNHINLPDPFITANLYLIGPRLDFTFSRKHFLTTFVQYNTQIQNLSINTRFQWRFAPASDFFLVYSDNYNTLDSYFGSRNRGVVAKLTYWLNL
ncbi:carbohydrate binding family 9 domain-containing protein [Saprospiraceae bacterium]|nr:carbohydrate binding family 9 domain-containing protein [Saprospiraceae bacterium]